MHVIISLPRVPWRGRESKDRDSEFKFKLVTVKRRETGVEEISEFRKP